jgi:hypothetical protein
MTKRKAIFTTALLATAILAILTICLFIRIEHISIGQAILYVAGFRYIIDRLCDFCGWLMKKKKRKLNRVR